MISLHVVIYSMCKAILDIWKGRINLSLQLLLVLAALRIPNFRSE